MLEVEVKVRKEHEAVRALLENLGFERKCSVYELDIYYNGEFKNLKKEDKALRIREHKDLDKGGSQFLMNFKGPKIDTITMSRQETEFEVPTFAHGDIMLTGLGYHPAGRVEKVRIYYEKGDITCCLDDVTELGQFLEIEVLTESEGGYPEALGKIEALLAPLNLSMEDSITTSYLSMLEKVSDTV